MGVRGGSSQPLAHKLHHVRQLLEAADHRTTFCSHILPTAQSDYEAADGVVHQRDQAARSGTCR